MAVVLQISSQVVRGHIGNAAAVFALQCLGHTVWPIATVTLAHHPGHDRNVPREVTPAAAIKDIATALDRRGWLAEVDAVAIGYLASAEQAGAIAALVRRLMALRPSARVMLDPVMGDDGRLYVDAGVAAAIGANLLPLATILTPNQFELSRLSGAPTGEFSADFAAAVAAARRLGPAEIVLTSAPGAPAGHVRTAAITAEAVAIADSPAIATGAHGAGDLIAALYLGHRLKDRAPREALARAVASLQGVIAATAAAGGDELTLVSSAALLAEAPAAPICAWP